MVNCRAVGWEKVNVNNDEYSYRIKTWLFFSKQFLKWWAFCHNRVGHRKASSFHPICLCVCVCMYVHVYTCIGLPPGWVIRSSIGESIITCSWPWQVPMMMGSNVQQPEHPDVSSPLGPQMISGVPLVSQPSHVVGHDKFQWWWAPTSNKQSIQMCLHHWTHRWHQEFYQQVGHVI